MLHNCKAHAANPAWHARGLIGSEFRSKHTVLLMFIWIINQRLLAEGKEGKLLQECLFEELWEDTCARIRGIGVGELSVNKHLGEVQKYSFRFCIELDHAISMASKANRAVEADPSKDSSALSEAEKEEQVIDAVGSTLWRMLYLRRQGDGLTEEHVFELARYLRREQQSVLQLSREAVWDGRIRWSPPPWSGAGWAKGVASGEVTATQSESGEWREAIAPDGRTYYWNTVTRESRWQK